LAGSPTAISFRAAAAVSYELVQLDDVHACARLIAAAALRLEPNSSFAR
jgi:putative aminopeptidase FrvX